MKSISFETQFNFEQQSSFAIAAENDFIEFHGKITDTNATNDIDVIWSMKRAGVSFFFLVCSSAAMYAVWCDGYTAKRKVYDLPLAISIKLWSHLALISCPSFCFSLSLSLVDFPSNVQSKTHANDEPNHLVKHIFPRAIYSHLITTKNMDTSKHDDIDKMRWASLHCMFFVQPSIFIMLFALCSTRTHILEKHKK